MSVPPLITAASKQAVKLKGAIDSVAYVVPVAKLPRCPV